MSYKTLTELSLFPEDIILHICQFTGPRPRWSYYWKSEFIEELNELQPYKHEPKLFMFYINQNYVANIIENSINLRINLMCDMLDSGITNTSMPNIQYKKMYEAALQNYK